MTKTDMKTEPATLEARLAKQPTQELKDFAMAQFRQALPWVPSQNGKRGRLAWTLKPDRIEIRY